ncbi:hypothetical protein [Fulvimarina endophytica]|uniref:hypothetical protein n=1 Tax=Fulvimarina endophytica TaxID=2293836 RepID=UPI0011C0461A|nr:hypothetical protein [Fulvimarina endophytica]
MAADTETLIAKLEKQRVCRRCSCVSCDREGAGEFHDHVCTDGEGCVESRDKLRRKVLALRILCTEAADRIAALQASQAEADARVLQAVEDERAACAKIADRQAWAHGGQFFDGPNGGEINSMAIAAAIRSQGGAE